MAGLSFAPYVLLFLGLSMLERGRRGGTARLVPILIRNLIIASVCGLTYAALGFEWMYPRPELQKAPTLWEILVSWRMGPHPHDFGGLDRDMVIADLISQAIYCVAASLVVAGGVSDLPIPHWLRASLVGIYSLVLYPILGGWVWGGGWLDQAGFRDFSGSLLLWSSAGLFVLGLRLLLGGPYIPDRDPSKPKGNDKPEKIGFVQRFLSQRGLAFLILFFVFATPPVAGLSFVKSKLLVLLTSSLTLLWGNFFFLFLKGRVSPRRRLNAPPTIALPAAFAALQGSDSFTWFQVVIVVSLTSFSVLAALRILPLGTKLWDPVYAVVVFGLGGLIGTLLTGWRAPASLGPQLIGIGATTLLAMGSGLLLGMLIRRVTPLVPEVQ